MALAQENCRPYRSGEAPLSAAEAQELAREVPGWSTEEGAITRELKFKGFRQAMDFTNQVAGLAEEQDHHPDILISYNRVRLTFSTHRIGGLSRNDFIMAAKVDLLLEAAPAESAGGGATR